MSETDEFAEALLAQLSVEINEEKEIASLSKKIKEDNEFKVEFGDTEKIAQTLFPDLAQKVNDYMGLSVSPDLSIVGLELEELKRFKGKKVFTTNAARQFVDELFYAVSKNDLGKISDNIKKDTTKFLVYSTYVKSYISKISTTYGDFLDKTIYLNKFVLDNYPKIILYKQRPPYEPKFGSVKSGYMGALKMTILEEIIHSVQNNLQRLNKEAVIQVNEINEELAKTILELDGKTVSQLSEYLQLMSVPEEFVIAKRANLFFMLNPDTFITNVLGPDIMTYNKVDIDPKILEFIPSLLEIYQRWLKPIQDQHAVSTTMEGMAEFVVQNILKNDPDFQNYLSTFIGTDYSAYSVKKSIGKEFTEKIFETIGKDTFMKLETNPPNTRELKDPQLYLNRIK
jgi:two-component sensor histidine kinase